MEKEDIIKLLVKERTDARNIAYEFMKKFEEKAKNSLMIDLRRKYSDIANECRLIGNAISGSNALSATLGETIEDRIRKEYKEFFE
jgi:hypothetical protein